MILFKVFLNISPYTIKEFKTVIYHFFSLQTKLELVWKIVRNFWVLLFQTKLDLVGKRTLNEM